MHRILVCFGPDPVVAYGNKTNGRCYGVDKETSQCDTKAIGKTCFMTTAIKREETGKVLIQVNVGSESNGIEQYCVCVHARERERERECRCVCMYDILVFVGKEGGVGIHYYDIVSLPERMAIMAPAIKNPQCQRGK